MTGARVRDGLLKAQRAVFESCLTSSEKLVMLAILDHWSLDSPRPFASLDRLAEMTSLGRRTVVRSVAALRRKGAVKVIPDGRKSSYDLSAAFADQLPAGDIDRCHHGTSATTAPVPPRHQSEERIGATVTANSATTAPGTVPLWHPKEPHEETQEGTRSSKSPKNDDERAVFEHWVTKTWTGRGVQPKLDNKRRSRIRARLRDGLTVEQLCQAVDGALQSPFHTGKNDAGRKYLGLHTIFRDCEAVEQHIARLHEAKPATADKPADPKRAAIIQRRRAAYASGDPDAQREADRELKAFDRRRREQQGPQLAHAAGGAV